jgi:hypothetical protein
MVRLARHLKESIPFLLESAYGSRQWIELA